MTRHLPTLRLAARRQRGQAMTEFVVGTVLFLLPLFLIIPMLGKYADVKAASAQTARYAAWERTVWYGGASANASWPGNSKTEAAIYNEGRRRVVAFGGVVAAADNNANSFTLAGGRALWRNRDSSAMLQNYSDVAGTMSNTASPDIITEGVIAPITAITSIIGFSLETDGLYTGTVAIPVTTLPIGSSLRTGSFGGSFDPGVLTFRDKNAILSNTWAANGKSHVKSQTVGLAPLGLLGDATLGPLLQIAGCLALGALAPEICFLEIGKIEPDVVPPDRLTP
jgi:hypothetical protein